MDAHPNENVSSKLEEARRRFRQLRRNVEELNELLYSDDAGSSAGAGSSGASTFATPVSQSQRSSALFSRGNLAEQLRNVQSRLSGGSGRTKKKAKYDSSFTLSQAILLKGSNRTRKKQGPVKKAALSQFRQDGQVKDLPAFNRSWSAERVRSELLTMFPRHDLTADFSILIPEGNTLEKPSFSNEELDGEAIYGLFFRQKRKIYILTQEDSTSASLQHDEWDLDDLSESSRLADNDSTSFSNSSAPSHSSDFQTLSVEPPVELQPTRPEPAQSQPTRPEPAQSQPTQPEPAQSQPTQPEPAQSQPTLPQPILERLTSEHVNNVRISDAPRTLEGVLALYAHLVTEESKTDWTVNRRDVWWSVLRGLRKKSFDPKKRLHITFTDRLGVMDTNLGVWDTPFNYEEEGRDIGGLSRNFFELALYEAQNSRLFSGPEHQRNLKYDADAATPINGKDEYQVVGELIALSMVQWGPSPNFFADSLYNAIISGKFAEPKISDIHEPSVVQVLKDLDAVVSLEGLQNILLEDVLQQAGLRSHVTTLNDKDQLLKQALYYYGSVKREPLLKSLCKGLEMYGLLHAIRHYKDIFKDCFICVQIPLTVNSFLSVFKIERSVQGSNAFALESRTLAFFNALLEDCEEGTAETFDGNWRLTLEDLLCFTTGSSRVPPLGFRTTPKILFNHDDSKCKVPKANTCVVSLYLPVANFEKYENFLDVMIHSIKSSPGFGVA